MAGPHIGFLFNHDERHQVAHLAGIVRALSLGWPGIRVRAYASKPALRAVAFDIIGPDAPVEWVDLQVRGLAGAIAPVADRLFPHSRLQALRQNVDFFRDLDILVSTERTCLLLKPLLGDDAPRFVHIPHGAGDRNVTYHPGKSGFDLFLVPGRKYAEAGQASGLLGADDWRIIGYPKFDALLDGRARPKLFDNDNPVFVYNPHFDPELSSFYDFGIDLIEHFAAHPDRYNLVVAPHVMLFRKKVHYSLEHRVLRIRPDIPRRLREAPNILVDTGSERLFDMSYTLAADAYIGDVSSQVYEFIARPRACFFLDSHDASEAGPSENYRFWTLGPVARSVPELGAMLPGWQAIAARYAARQAEQFAFSIDLGSEPASLRGARALADYAGVSNNPANAA